MRKQTFFNLLMLCVMSIVSLSSWADRARPTIPTTTLESGKTYYLYNVEADLFWAGGNRSTSKIDETPRPTELTQLDNGSWIMRFTDDTNTSKYYHYRSGQYVYCNDESASSSSSWWTISATGIESTYTIQTSPLHTSSYNADQYVGWVGNNSDYIYADRASDGNIHWQLIPADETGNRYVASLKLYKALQMNDGYYDNLVTSYESLYTNRATSDVDEMTNAAIALRNGLKMAQGYQAPYWNEYPILWATSDGTFGDNYYYTWALPNSTKDLNGNTIYNSTGSYFSREFFNGNGSSTLSATVNVDELSTFVYSTSGSSDDDAVIKVYVDDLLVRTLKGYQKSDYPTRKTYARFAEVLQPGKHTIKWEASTTSTNDRSFQIRNAGVVKSPLITVSLLEPGSLGTEVLYNTDHIKNVRRLKVKGKMNDDDWAKIKMMSGLLDLDLSEAEFTEIPEKQFQVQDNDTVMQFLHRLILPEGLEKINQYAFYYSFIDTLALPSTVKNIRESAFQYSHIQEINMPDDCTEIYGDETQGGYRVFEHMYWLKKLNCAKNWIVIPAYTFNDNPWIEELTLPEKLEAIGSYAFQYCKRMNVTFPEGLKKINEYAFYECQYTNFSSLPQSLEYIGREAFENCDGLAEIVIPTSVKTIGTNIFEGCSNLKTAELGVNIWYATNNILTKCNSLTTLRLNCPTVVGLTSNSSSYPVDADKIANVDLIVPSFLVNAYKLDKYWYNFKSITGFSTAEIQDWTINNPLVLNHDRFDGTPNITIKGNYDRLPSLKFNGTAEQNINNLFLNGSSRNYKNYPGQIYSNGENIKINGTVRVDLETEAKCWYFFCLPYDCKISDIIHGTENTQYAIRYYDGANRASVGATGSWKNYDKTNDVIPAGTGFIIQTNVYSWNGFYAVNNNTKQNIVSYKEFSKTLDVNDSETASNKGWNLIGNPYQCFYNSHCLNFTAPITVWDAYNRTYTAYSLTDDDYAIRPNEAFFVQCPSAEYSTITFPLQGRQLNDVIESQNAAKGAAPSVNTRKLVNITMSNGEQSDQTRIVLNENAKLDYEMNCDASKFASMDNSVPQLFTINNGTQYAINERPVADGKVQLGFYAAKTGSYTISLNRCDAEHVYLVDNETAETTEITNGEYTFTAKAGNNTSRFVIVFNDGETTGISSVNNEQLTVNNGSCYNLAGQRVQNTCKGVVIVNGKKVIK